MPIPAPSWTERPMTRRRDPRSRMSTTRKIANCVRIRTHAITSAYDLPHLWASWLARRRWYAEYSQWSTASVEHTRGVKEARISSLAWLYLRFLLSAAFLATASVYLKSTPGGYRCETACTDALEKLRNKWGPTISPSQAYQYSTDNEPGRDSTYSGRPRTGHPADTGHSDPTAAHAKAFPSADELRDSIERQMVQDGSKNLDAVMSVIVELAQYRGRWDACTSGWQCPTPGEPPSHAARMAYIGRVLEMVDPGHPELAAVLKLYLAGQNKHMASEPAGSYRRKDAKMDSREQGHAKPGNPGAKPSDPGAKAENPGAKPGNPGAKTGSLGAEAGNPGPKPSDPGGTAAGPCAKAENPGATTAGPGAKAENPGATAADSGGKADNPGAKPGNPGAETGNLGAKPSDPGATPTGPAATPAGPGAKGEKPGATPADSGAKAENPGAEAGNPGPKPGDHGAKPGDQGAYQTAEAKYTITFLESDFWQFCAWAGGFSCLVVAAFCIICQAQRSENQQLRQRVDDLSTTNARLKIKEGTLEQNLCSSRQKVTALETVIAQLNIHIETLSSSIRRLQRQVSDSRNEILALESCKTRLEVQVTESLKTIANLQWQLDVKQKMLDNAKPELEKMDPKTSSWKQVLWKWGKDSFLKMVSKAAWRLLCQIIDYIVPFAAVSAALAYTR